MPEAAIYLAIPLRIIFMSRRILILLILGAVLLVTLPKIITTGSRTWTFATTANGLTTIAMLGPDEWTLNPMSPNGLSISPGIAKWLLLHTDFPYAPCRKPNIFCEAPIVSFVGAAANLQKSNPAKRELAFMLLSHFISHGVSINAKHSGFTPLHDAVLLTDIRYLDVLLAVGADVRIKSDVSPYNKRYAGLTPYEYCLKLVDAGDTRRALLCEHLRIREADALVATPARPSKKTSDDPIN